MGRFTIQLFLEEVTWITKYIIDKSTIYCISSTEWSLLKKGFTEKNMDLS